MPCAPCAIATSRSPRASPPTRRPAIGASAASAANPSQPSVAAPGCVGVGSTGPSTAKSSAERAGPRDLRPRVWHDARAQQVRGPRGRRGERGRRPVHAVAAPRARAVASSPLSSTCAPCGRGERDAAPRASARCRAGGQSFSRSWISASPRCSAARARARNGLLAELARHRDPVDRRQHQRAQHRGVGRQQRRHVERARASATRTPARRGRPARRPTRTRGRNGARRARADRRSAGRARARRGDDEAELLGELAVERVARRSRRARACRPGIPSSRRRPCPAGAGRAAPARPARRMTAAATRTIASLTRADLPRASAAAPA